MGPLDTVKAALQAYIDKDRAAIEALIADDYSFTSPLDNAIDRETYFRLCWPNSEGMTGMDFVAGAEDGDFAWITYEGGFGDRRSRNTEYHRVRDGQLVATEVYFGWNLPHPVPAGEHDDDRAKSAG
jgi:hypothetical protein